MDGGFAPTFKEAVGRWRRRHRHPPPSETWFAVHYRVGWLVERLNTLESIHLMRQGLDVRSLSAERPARKRKGDSEADGLVAANGEGGGSDPDEESPHSVGVEPSLKTTESAAPSPDAG